jgi:hypothetical protein
VLEASGGRTVESPGSPVKDSVKPRRNQIATGREQQQLTGAAA